MGCDLDCRADLYGNPRGGGGGGGGGGVWTRSIIAESAILIAIDFEWDFFKLLLLWL